MARFVGAILVSAVLVLATAIWASGFVTLVAIIVLLAWAIRGEAELARRSTRSKERKVALAERVDGPLPPEALDYLARVDASLGLPQLMRAEIHAELADHLSDSIAAIQAEGRDLGLATGEALARLGQPNELAGQLRKAHQTTRRLLAGAAGGVWSAGVGAVQGYIVAVTALLLAAVIFGVGLKPLVDFVFTQVVRIQIDQNELAFGTVVGAMLSWAPAFVAGRRAVRACAEISGRPTAQLGRWWALGGLVGLGWLVMFFMAVQQSWLVVAFELAIPFAFAVGVLVKVESRLPAISGSWVALVGGLLLVASIGVFMVATTQGSSSGSGWAYSFTDDSIGWNHVAPHSPDEAISLNYGTRMAVPTIHVNAPPALSSFHDLRLEAWRATAYPGMPYDVETGLLDTTYSAPFMTAPAVVGTDGTIEDHLNLSHSRTPRWWIFLTGVAPDGQRYWLGSEPGFVYTQFSGTIWDWLTASN